MREVGEVGEHVNGNRTKERPNSFNEICVITYLLFIYFYY